MIGSMNDLIHPQNLRTPGSTLGAPWDAKVDIYRLGYLTLELVSGLNPFPGQDDKNGR